jgi:hypothetical protein
LDLVWDRKVPLAPCNDAPRRSTVIAGRGVTRHVGDHQARAICLKAAGRRQKLAIAGGFPDSQTRGEK